MTADRASVERAALTAALQRVAAGDRQALHDVYRRTAAKLYGVCLRIFPDPEEAQDVLQDAYLTVWRKASAFDPALGSPITWLVRVTRNRAIDRRRASARHVAAPIEWAEDEPDARPDPEACLLQADGAAQIERCLLQLTDGDQRLIRTAFFDGATYSDLADRSGKPLGTVKSRIRRALAKLRECLQ